MDETQEKLKKGRPLIIYDPDGKIPPARLQELFETETRKNNFCILTGSKTVMTEFDQAARSLYAVHQGEVLLPKERETEDFQSRKRSAEHHFLSTVLALFNQLLFSSWDKNNGSYLRAEPIIWQRNDQSGFQGEENIIRILADTSIRKLILDVDNEYDTVRKRAERDLFDKDLVHPGNLEYLIFGS